MRNLYLILILAVSSFFSASAQTENPLNCGTDDFHRQLELLHPDYKARWDQFNEQRDSRAMHRSAQDDEVVYTIPVVVHLMHPGEPVGTGVNVSDETVYQAIKGLNERFANIGFTQNDNGQDTKIRFALAVRDPQGNCTNGINRIDMSGYPEYVANGIYRTSIGMDQEAVRDLSRWDQSKYYNIWVVNEMDGNLNILGFAAYPSAVGLEYDGTMMVATALANPLGDTLTHEIGHALNLLHTFEGDQFGCPPVTNGCGDYSGDCCEDIPPHKREEYDCDQSDVNSCDGSSTDLFTFSFMNYTYCRDRFSPNQITRMRDAIAAFRSSLLVENGNDALIPIFPGTVSFSQSETSVCVGDSVQFYDHTGCMPNTFLPDTAWNDASFSWVFNNGSESITSELQNPLITFSQPGTYQVLCTVTAQNSSAISNVEATVFVQTPAGPTCAPESIIMDQYGNTVNRVVFAGIDHTTLNWYNEGYRDMSCSQFTSVTAGESYPIQVWLKGNYAREYMQAYIDYDNNGAYEDDEMVLEGDYLGYIDQAIEGTVNIPESAVTDTLLRMRVIGEGGNAPTPEQRDCTAVFQLGDVEDYGLIVSPALSNPEFASINWNVFPNPSTGSFRVEGSRLMDSDISITDVLGKRIASRKTSSGVEKFELGLESGVYFVNVQKDGVKMVKRLLVK